MGSARDEEGAGRLAGLAPELYMLTDGSHVRRFYLGRLDLLS